MIRDVAIADGRVAGVVTSGRDGQALTHPARMVIAADGRRSAIAIGRGLSRQPQRPRRWAIGAYFSDVDRRDDRLARCTCGAATTSASRRCRAG